MSIRGRDQKLEDTSTRGQTAVIGVVVLIGMVAIASLGLLVVATDSISQVERAAEQDRIEQSFIQLSQSISTSTSQADVTHHTSLDAGEHGAIARHDSATYEIWAKDENETRADLGDGTLGTIEYESDDGTMVAYEGGAVFRNTGEETQVLSTPPVSYDRETSTLQFSVVGLSEAKTLDSGEIELHRVDVDDGDLNYIEDHRVYIEIESDYCQGWENYFAGQAGNTVVEEECYDGSNEEGKLKARLGYGNIEDAFSSGMALPPGDNIQQPRGNTSIDYETDEFRPLNDVIDSLKDDFSNKSAPSSEETSGEFFAESLTGTYDFNLSDGDAIVVVDGDVEPDGITVTDCADGDHSLKIYATGDFDLEQSVTYSGSCNDVSAIQLYGTDTSRVDFHASADKFRGLIYVASDKFDPNDGDSDYQVDFTGFGAGDFEGAIIAHSVAFDTAVTNTEFKDAGNSGINIIPKGHEPAPKLIYLNIVEQEIEIENAG